MLPQTPWLDSKGPTSSGGDGREGGVGESNAFSVFESWQFCMYTNDTAENMVQKRKDDYKDQANIQAAVAW